MNIQYKKIAKEATQPSKGHDDDAGWDLYTLEEVTIAPGAYAEVPTGIAVEFPQNVWGRITGRSSTTRKLGLMVIEGIIDTGYRGELFVRVYNPGIYAIEVRQNRRIAQMIPHLRIDLKWEETKTLSKSERGNNGFGSTGK
jgi:deoxyuridine 5'-triphosphate nucleotidohydrolase